MQMDVRLIQTKQASICKPYFMDQIQKDGSFIRTSQNDKLGYLVMVLVRSVIIWHSAAQSLAQAVTIAVRYGCVRHQSELRPGSVSLIGFLHLF